MITGYTLCNDRPVRVPASAILDAPWDSSSVVCCEACASVALTRFSWMEVYA